MKSKIKVVFLIGQLGLGGSERQLYLLLKHFDPKCFSLSVVVFNPSPNMVLNDALTACGVKVYVIPEDKTSVGQRIQYLYRLLRKIQPQIVHSWTLHDNAYAGLVGWLAGIPLRWGSVRGSLSDSGFQKLPRLYRWMCLWVVSKLVVNAESIRTELRHLGLPETRIEVLPNCVELFPEFSPPDLTHFGITSGHQVIGIVGNIRPVKNHALFVDALIQLLPSYPNLRAIIVGHPISGYEGLAEQLQARIDQANLSERIFILGFRDDVPALMRCLDIFCLTSNSEGTPNVILEAMAAARPIVATNVGGVTDVVQHGVNGLLVERGNVESLVEALKTLLEYATLAIQMGQNGRERVAKHFSCSTVVQKLMNVYTQELYSKQTNITNRPVITNHE